MQIWLRQEKRLLGGDNVRLKNKVALMCGIGPGMGMASAILFAQEGAKVMISSRRETHIKETVSRIQCYGGESTALPADVSVREEVDSLVEHTVKKYGRIDILYCGAGGFFEPNRDFSDINENYWKEAVTNTINSLYNLSQAVRPVMARQGIGSIVSITASASVRQEGNPAYGASKAGIIGITQNLARKFYADNIRVNAVGAGLFRAKLASGPATPAVSTLSRTGHPEDIAYAALYLASDEAGWVTGQVLNVDGGVDVGSRPLWEFEQ